jgi:hypothetical protein
MSTRVKYLVASSRKAWRERIWPTLEWAIFDREGNYLRGGFRTRREACAWRDANLAE